MNKRVLAIASHPLAAIPSGMVFNEPGLPLTTKTTRSR